ncbi:MAG: GGDEF domain-containing protein [Colwelliaceae bacterium]|nr:GGDEF domain-containing protein [Colwelliaceae bacterium]
MSLSKRLYLGLISVLSLVFLSTVWINVVNTSHFIDRQLESHAQDTATSLGLSIAPFVGIEEEMATIDSMVSAIFDSGYYQHVILTNSDGSVMLERHNPIELDQVPQWFIQLFPLNPPMAETEVFDGWVKPKTLAIMSHPGFGYLKLWHSAVNSFWMILGLFVFAGTLVFFVLRTITTPIKRAAKQADEICQGNFVQVSDIPKPVELNLFVKAMNRMSHILQKMFNDLSEQTEKYQKYAFVDELTQLSNRRAFNNQFSSLLSDQEQAHAGYLIIVRLMSLDAINKANGYVAGDNYVLEATKAIKETIKQTPEDTIIKAYRLTGGEFAILVDDDDKSQCQQLIENLMSRFQESAFIANDATGDAISGKSLACIGATPYEVNGELGTIMSMADNALVAAQEAQAGWAFSSDSSLPQGSNKWKDELEHILNQEQVSFVAQDICDVDGKVAYQELFARFTGKEDTNAIPVGKLVRVAERLNLAVQLDQMVISKALALVADKKKEFAINVSAASLKARSFSHWLINQIESHSDIAELITFEINEESLNFHADNVLELLEQLKALGCKITIERFGASTSSFAHLMRIKPTHVKIDGSYCLQVEKSPENQLFIQSLTNIAHSLNITVIAEMVETSSQAEQLQTLFVDYYQGYGIKKPEAI